MEKIIFEKSPVSHVVINETGEIIKINEKAIKMLNVQEEDILSMLFHELPFEHLDTDIFKDVFRYTNYGEEKIIRVTREPIISDGSKFELISLFDISKFNQKMSHLILDNNTLNHYIDTANLIFLLLDLDANILFINSRGKDILKIKDSYVGENWIEQFIPDENREAVRKVFEDVKRGTDEFNEFIEGDVVDAKGNIMTIGWSNNVYYQEDKTECILSVGMDLTWRKLNENELFIKATTDSLTQVYNRWTGLEILEKQFNHAIRHHEVLSVCYIDLDGLKTINDHLGHAAGDDYLMRSVKILQQSVRDEDSIVRMGGDEFMIIFPEADEADAYKIIERVVRRFNHYNQEKKHGYDFSISYGITDTTHPEVSEQKDLIHLSDHRMYEMKRKSKGNAND
jgi:diguanylate cyclase (GGDEF)-like protein